jgi:hypothetical protein
MKIADTMAIFLLIVFFIKSLFLYVCILRGCAKSPFSRHCELRGTKQEANQSVDIQWIASGYCPRNDGINDFLHSLMI